MSDTTSGQTRRALLGYSGARGLGLLALSAPGIAEATAGGGPSAISAARFYWELHLSPYDAANVSIPAAVSVFPGENYQAPLSWTERAYHKLIYFNKVDKGGHYAAWEQPKLFSEEVRAGFRSLR
jgi:pimeloyl-ACP methyl ester carboxylesterase